MSLEKKIAIVTGCSSGVGMHAALLLARQGIRVYATMRNLEKSKQLEELAQKENIDLRILQLDVQDEASVLKAVSQVISETGQIDLLINNAGFGSVLTLEQASFEQIEEIMDVNFYGAARCIRAVLPHMRSKKSGHILTVTSVGGLVGQPLNEIYCAAKFALEGLIESMATYLEPYFNIKMTLIEPGGIKTNFVNRIRADLQTTPIPLQDVYGPILSKYQETFQKRGSSAQSADEVAQVIVNCVTSSTLSLRVQTNERATDFAIEKLRADPSGNLLQKKIRKFNLDLD